MVKRNCAVGIPKLQSVFGLANAVLLGEAFPRAAEAAEQGVSCENSLDYKLGALDSHVNTKYFGHTCNTSAGAFYC